MLRIRIILLVFPIMLMHAELVMSQVQGFLHTRGQDIVDETGKKILLQGVGLGNWLLPEGYMWKFGDAGDRPRKIEKIVQDLIGAGEADHFWTGFRQNYITEADIKRMAELGFDSVRPALNARRFLSEDDQPVFINEAFELLDNLITWCRKYNIYVIIDMHGAPGGQTGANIDDSPDDLPELFMDKKYQDRLVDLWVKIADRYKNEPAVAAYDLLNEPLPERTGAAGRYKEQLEPLYKRITAAIRRVDTRHMITLEGVDWANDWSVFSAPFDNNLFYQFHYYCWDRPDQLKSIAYFLDRRKELNTPVWVGETGEKGNTIYWGTTQYFEANNIGWSFWPWKKMDTHNTPYSINKPDGWDEVIAYSKGQGKPSAELSRQVFDQLLENIRIENCAYFPDVINAIFHRIPGKVEAENYGHLGFKQSYFVKDTTSFSEVYRRSEPVQIQVIEANKHGHVSEQCIKLTESEWTVYNINCPGTITSTASIKVRAEDIPTEFSLIVNGKSNLFKINTTGWNILKLGDYDFNQGAYDIKFLVSRGTIYMDWFKFE